MINLEGAHDEVFSAISNCAARGSRFPCPDAALLATVAQHFHKARGNSDVCTKGIEKRRKLVLSRRRPPESRSRWYPDS